MIRSFTYIPLFVVAASVAFSQETGNPLVGPHAELTIFDEIEDRRERDAFREVWNTTGPRAKRARADAFLERYPASRMLRDAYELGARASADLGDHADALRRARLSLRLLPENPFLLVMTADIAAKQADLSLAERSARDALRHLANADTPSPLARADWPRVRDHLRATAYFVLGRVAATRGEHADAKQSLLMALALNPAEIDALYTLAVVQLALGDARAAAVSFAHVMRTPGPLANPARQFLGTLHRRQAPAVGFDAYAASLRWAPPKPLERAPSPAAGAYAGSEACRECHAAVYKQWQSTGMARMFRAYRAADVIGDFGGSQIVSHLARPLLRDGRHFIEVRASRSAQWIRYPVDYVIGSKWQQAYATRLPDSRILVFPIQYSRKRSEWVNYWGVVDGPGSERADISRFHTFPNGAVYQTSCAPCHTSQLKFSEGIHRAASGTFREEGINCEMCHGPSQEHIVRIRSGDTSPPSNPDLPLRFSRLPADTYLAVCAQCHAQSAIHDADAAGNANYSDQMPFFRAYPTHLPSNFSRKAFFRDGRHRATTFIVEAFARSECFRKGNATCGSCHNPHPPDAETNPTSLEFRGNPDQMCVQCHTALAQRPQEHTRHAPGSEASRCISCHMPPIMDALLFPARTHEIDDIPDAEMTARFGNEESPNACLMCHTDRDVKWLRKALLQF
jgi:predicted CXXCH cytochrome family protein